MLKERLLEAARENLRLTQECAVATEKFNLMHSIFSGGHISNPVHVLGTQSAQTHVESLRDSSSGSIGAPQPNFFSPVPNVPQQPTFFLQELKLMQMCLPCTHISMRSISGGNNSSLLFTYKHMLFKRYL